MSISSIQPVLIDGAWTESDSVSTFAPVNPLTKEPTNEVYPVSSIKDVETAIECAAEASDDLLNFDPTTIADFLECYADRIEARRSDLVDMAHLETAYPKETRLGGIELPRTINQLRLAANAVRNRSWMSPTIDTQTNIRSMYAALEGGVVVFGPNNFPFAFGSISGGDFAAAVAAGNPVIAKANSSHPGTTRLFAEEALEAVKNLGLPNGMVQLIYRTHHDVGERLVSHPLVGATGYTGSRVAGLVLKNAADRAGKPIYLELSSVNPVVILPGALQERGAEIAEEFVSSCLLGTGQFCTNPGLMILQKDTGTDLFIQSVSQKFRDAPVGTLLGESVEKGMVAGVQTLQDAGAELVVGGKSGGGTGFCHQNTLLQVTGAQFLSQAENLQKEIFGNESLLVLVDDLDQAHQVLRLLEGNLTGTIYSASDGTDDIAYGRVASILRRKVGRLINDKMPTGVAVSSAMNHGGPFPATGHPSFTSVGIPAAITRFSQLQCFDNVSSNHLPVELQDENPLDIWRFIDGEWTH